MFDNTPRRARLTVASPAGRRAEAARIVLDEGEVLDAGGTAVTPGRNDETATESLRDGRPVAVLVSDQRGTILEGAP